MPPSTKGNNKMDNETFLHEIKIRRDLHSAINHLVMLAVRVIEIEKHLGIGDEKRTQKEAS